MERTFLFLVLLIIAHKTEASCEESTCQCPSNVQGHQLLCGNEISGDQEACKPEGIYICNEGNQNACLHRSLGDCGAKKQMCDVARSTGELAFRKEYEDEMVNSPPTLTKFRMCYPTEHYHHLYPIPMRPIQPL